MTAEHMIRIGRNGSSTRTERARLRAAVLDGTLDVRNLLADPPEALRGLTVAEVLMFVRATKCGSQKPLQWLEAQAVRDGVNLFMPVHSASRRTRQWAADHAPSARRKPAA